MSLRPVPLWSTWPRICQERVNSCPQNRWLRWPKIYWGEAARAKPLRQRTACPTRHARILVSQAEPLHMDTSIYLNIYYKSIYIYMYISMYVNVFACTVTCIAIGWTLRTHEKSLYFKNSTPFLSAYLFFCKIIYIYILQYNILQQSMLYQHQYSSNSQVIIFGLIK